MDFFSFEAGIWQLFVRDVQWFHLFVSVKQTGISAGTIPPQVCLIGLGVCTELGRKCVKYSCWTLISEVKTKTIQQQSIRDKRERRNFPSSWGVRHYILTCLFQVLISYLADDRYAVVFHIICYCANNNSLSISHKLWLLPNFWWLFCLPGLFPGKLFLLS